MRGRGLFDVALIFRLEAVVLASHVCGVDVKECLSDIERGIHANGRPRGQGIWGEFVSRMHSLP